MKRLRIAICVAHFHPVVGGSERQMQQLAERWSDCGHEVFVLTRAVRGLPTHETLGKVQIHRVIRTLAFGPAFGATYLASLAAQLVARRRQYDVLVAGQLPWEAVATGFAARRLGKPAVAFAASTGPAGDVEQLLRAKGSRFLCRLVRSNSRLIALSSQARQELLALGCDEKQVVNSTNGVDLDRYQPVVDRKPDRDRTVLFLSRLAPAKNPQLLLRAWKAVNGDGRYRLIVAGDGPLAGELHRLAAELSLANIEFTGNVSDVPSAHRRAGVFVLPSPSEGCSNALLEAMASGLCPVVSRVPGNLDVVEHDVNGLLFHHTSERELADALTRVLVDQPLRERLSSAARQHVVAQHDLNKIAAELIDLLDQLG